MNQNQIPATVKAEKEKEKHSDKENKDGDVGIEIDEDKAKEKEKEKEMDVEVEKDIIDKDQKVPLDPFSVTPVTPGININGKDKDKEKEKEREKGKESDIETQYVCVGSMKRPAMSLTRFLRETEKRRRAVLDGVIHNC